MRLRSESPEQHYHKETAEIQPMSSRLEKFLGEEKRLLLETERRALYDIVTEFFVNFCGCHDNIIRRCLFQPTNLDLLCHFFGSTRGKFAPNFI